MCGMGWLMERLAPRGRAHERETSACVGIQERLLLRVEKEVFRCCAAHGKHL